MRDSLQAGVARLVKWFRRNRDLFLRVTARRKDGRRNLIGATAKVYGEPGEAGISPAGP
jgi:hypothetical protein